MKSFICVVLILCISSIHSQKLSAGDAKAMNELSIVQYNAASYYRYVSQYFHSKNLFGFKKFFMKLADLKSENAMDILQYISGRTDALPKPQFGSCSADPYSCYDPKIKLLETFRKALKAETWNRNNISGTIKKVMDIPMRHFLLKFLTQGSNTCRQLYYMSDTQSKFSSYFEIYLFNERFVDSIASVRNKNCTIY